MRLAWARHQRVTPFLDLAQLAQLAHGVQTVTTVPGPGGRWWLAVGSCDGTVRLWDPRTGDPVGEPVNGYQDAEQRQQAVWLGVEHPVAAVALPGGGVALAGCWLNTVRLWRAATGETLQEFAIGRVASHVTSSCASMLVAVNCPDGNVVLATAAWGGRVQRWQPLTGRPVGDPLPGPIKRSLVVIPVAGGRTLLAAIGGEVDGVLLWDADTGTPVSSPVADRVERLRGLAALSRPDGRPVLATADSAGRVQLWDLVSGELIGQPGPGFGNAVDLGAASLMGTDATMAGISTVEGRMLLASGGLLATTIHLWDISAAGATEPLRGLTQPLTALTTLPGGDGRILLASGDRSGRVRLWDEGHRRTRWTTESVPAHTGPVSALAVLPLRDGRTLLASGCTGRDDTAIRLWDLASGESAGQPLTGHCGDILALSAVPLPGGRMLLASASADASVAVWDPNTGHRVWETVFDDPVSHVVGLPVGGRTVVASLGEDCTIRWWDAPTGEPIRHPRDDEYGVSGPMMALSMPDGRTLLASRCFRVGHHTVRLWDPATGNPVSDLPCGGATALAALPMPDGHTLLAVTGGDWVIRLWDLASDEPTGQPLTGHCGDILALSAVPLPDGRVLLAGAAADNTIRTWDPAAGQQHHVLHFPDTPLALAAAGTRLAVGSPLGVTIFDTTQMAGV
jgi:WD40 repeat protein